VRAENDIPAAWRHFGPVTIVGAREKEFACGELQIVLSKHTLRLEPERFSAIGMFRVKGMIRHTFVGVCIEAIDGDKLVAVNAA
jgi:hypothetical protein